ncbi:ATP-grasp domain-containing protein [Schleiferilactobacillus harbinensis]|uniref:ATP-grasp domain-containing protein n=1 Tax=Schleiferilactobacillus harbinensis TaxID=304207 RepID=UPI0039EACEEE
MFDRIAGDYHSSFDATILNAAVAIWTGVPVAYSLDIGATQDGKNLIVEANDRYAFGSYGLSPYKYAAFLQARRQQLIARVLQKTMRLLCLILQHGINKTVAVINILMEKERPAFKNFAVFSDLIQIRSWSVRLCFDPFLNVSVEYFRLFTLGFWRQIGNFKSPID